jgi:hypothetical protein
LGSDGRACPEVLQSPISEFTPDFGVEIRRIDPGKRSEKVGKGADLKSLSLFWEGAHKILPDFFRTKHHSPSCGSEW